ncbi:MAG: type II toxin-antitoxin system HicB family antitoxin [Planctomycetota bacterium]
MIEYKGYFEKVEYDAEANILHGEVLGIRDVVTFQARSVDEVERAFHESADDYLAFCRDRREKTDKPCSGKFVVRIGSDLRRRVAALAQESHKSINTIFSECLQDRSARVLPAPAAVRPGDSSPPDPEAKRPACELAQHRPMDPARFRVPRAFVPVHFVPCAATLSSPTSSSLQASEALWPSRDPTNRRHGESVRTLSPNPSGRPTLPPTEPEGETAGEVGRAVVPACVGRGRGFGGIRLRRTGSPVPGP